MMSKFHTQILRNISEAPSSMNDVPPEREGGRRGYKKLAVWGDFQGITGVTRGRERSKNHTFGMTSFMDGL